MFFQRMYERHHKHRCFRRNCAFGDSQSLDQAEEEKSYKILSNLHRKSFELGLYNGNQITVVRNNAYQRNLIIAVGESRYIISKGIARHILVEEIKAE